MSEVIYTEHLSKQFKDFHAVKDLCLSVNKGEIYGFLGLNGAGKTTTIRMLLGMMKPTAGTSYLNGQKVDAASRDIWKGVGYLVETPYSYPELTVLENLEMIKKLRGIKDSSTVKNILKKLSLEAYSNIKSKHLSLGNAQRLGLAKALLHQPSILILDEPANGLDPSGIVEIRELLQDLAHHHGTTIFISSHILDEVSKLASRIGIIHQGKLIQELASNQLDLLRHKRLVISTTNNASARELLFKQGYTVTPAEDGLLEIPMQSKEIHPEQIATALVHSGCPPIQLKVEVEGLESYFLRAIQKTGGNEQ